MRRRPGHASFEDADLALEQTLEELDVNVPHYNEWVRSLVEPAAFGTVLELGAGVGTFTHALLQTAAHVVAVEPSARASAVLANSTIINDRVTAVHGYVRDAVNFAPFDGAVLSNVLEHIETDEAVLKELFGLVRPGGSVAVFSPAFPLLMSRFDRSIGHVRRYRKRDLCHRFERAGFEITAAHYVNLPGFFAWLLVTRLLGRRPTDRLLSRLYDNCVVPSTRWIEARVKPPFGQSILVIGRVPPLAQQARSQQASSEPVSSEPASLEPVLSEPLLSEPVSSEPVSSEPVSSQPALSSEPLSSEPALSEPVSSEPLSSEPVLSAANRTRPAATAATVACANRCGGPSRRARRDHRAAGTTAQCRRGETSEPEVGGLRRPPAPPVAPALSTSRWRRSDRDVGVRTLRKTPARRMRTRRSPGTPTSWTCDSPALTPPVHRGRAH